MLTSDLPNITRRQQDILRLLYSYRFLNRIQIQTLLEHKDYKTINMWLKDLTAKGYTVRIYNPNHFAEKTKPAIYYLALNGIRYLKSRNYDDEYEQYATTELRKRYRESSRSQSYIDRCLLLADCTISLDQARDETSYPNTYYFYETEADYVGGSYYHFMSEAEYIHPQLCFSKEQYDGWGEPYSAEHYLLEVFDTNLPRYRLKKRLTNYVQYLDEESDEWKRGAEHDKLPIVLLICQRTSDLIYAKRRTRGLLAELWEYDDTDKPHIRFATVKDIQAQGVLGDVWEEA